MKIWVTSSYIDLQEYLDSVNGVYTFIGEINEDFFKSVTIDDKRIKQFPFIDVDFNTIFNYKQTQQLSKEIEILKNEISFQKEALEIIKKGIKMILENKEKNLYLRFEYD